MSNLNAVALTALMLISASFSGSQQQSENTAVDSRITCSISVANPVWTTPDTTVITIDLENVSDQDVEIDSSAILTLAPDVSTGRPWLNSYWAPIDIRRDTPAVIDEKPPGTIQLRHPLFTLPAHSNTQFSIHAANMKWDRRISSQWPILPLKAVATAAYLMQIELDSSRGAVVSKSVSLEIRRAVAQTHP